MTENFQIHFKREDFYLFWTKVFVSFRFVYRLVLFRWHGEGIFESRLKCFSPFEETHCTNILLNKKSFQTKPTGKRTASRRKKKVHFLFGRRAKTAEIVNDAHLAHLKKEHKLNDESQSRYFQCFFILSFLLLLLLLSRQRCRQYTWIDERGKKIRLSAPQYIDYVMTYAQRTVNDEGIFPTKFGNCLWLVSSLAVSVCLCVCVCNQLALWLNGMRHTHTHAGHRVLFPVLY